MFIPSIVPTRTAALMDSPTSVIHTYFLSWLGVFLLTPAPYEVYARESGSRLTRTENRLDPSNYDIACPGKLLTSHPTIIS